MPIHIPALLSLILVLSIGGCAEKVDKKPPPPPIKVGVVTIKKGVIEKTLDISGGLSFIANTTVSSEVAAQVKSIEVVDGQKVQEGQTLLIFDETKIRETANQALANLQKNQALLAFSKTEWEKNHELFKSHAISQTQYDQKLSVYQNALAQVEADKAALAKANTDLNKTQVLSPITGLVANRHVEKGDWVAEGGKLFVISDYSRMYLEAFLSDIDVGKLNVQKIVTEGIDGQVTVDSYPDRVYRGKLTYIQPIANQGRLFQVRFYLNNPDMSLLQGMFARGKIVYQVIRDVPRVPLAALLEQVRENETNTVFLVDQNGKAELARVKIGNTDPVYAEIVEGIVPGSIVVTQGKEILNSGQPLKTTNLDDETRSPDAKTGGAK
jgi:membrane fusion protein (multidrug efflux system)